MLDTSTPTTGAVMISESVGGKKLTVALVSPCYNITVHDVSSIAGSGSPPDLQVTVISPSPTLVFTMLEPSSNNDILIIIGAVLVAVVIMAAITGVLMVAMMARRQHRKPHADHPPHSDTLKLPAAPDSNHHIQVNKQQIACCSQNFKDGLTASQSQCVNGLCYA